MPDERVGEHLIIFPKQTLDRAAGERRHDSALCVALLPLVYEVTPAWEGVPTSDGHARDCWYRSHAVMMERFLLLSMALLSVGAAPPNEALRQLTKSHL